MVKPKKLVENPSPIISSQNLGWESIIVEEFQQPPRICQPDSWQEHTIALCLAHKPLRIWQAIGDRSYSGIYAQGDITITPAAIINSYQAYGDDHYILVRIPTQLVKQVATEALNSNPDCIELITEFRVRNLQIQQLAMMLRDELHQGNSGFNSHSHLGKYFRASTGMTPKAYRQDCISQAKFFR